MDGRGVAAGADRRERVGLAVRGLGFFVQRSGRVDFHRHRPLQSGTGIDRDGVLMQDAESAVQMLRALKAIGVQLAIDDFGVGYSSFSYLRKFPLDALKVDRSFIHDISSNPGNATILSALINIGKSLKHRVVAEGVETEEQLHFLQKEGCSEGQGYFFCRPVIAEQFAQFLERGVAESVVH